MTQNIYIAGVELGSGKSAIVLTLMELLSGETSKLGFFQPLVHGNVKEDKLIKLVVDRYFQQQDSELPVYLVPTVAALEKPTISDITNKLNARILSGGNECLMRDVLNYKVAAMQVPHFLDHLEEGDLIITPGDRSDIILASLMAHNSSNYPQISGLLLSGKQEPDSQISRLISGISKPPFTVMGVDTDTFTTAINVTGVQTTLYYAHSPI